MNWIERMYEIKGKDLYSQNGEGLLLEYILNHVSHNWSLRRCLDIGGSDGFYLSNTKHLQNLGYQQFVFDIENGYKINLDNVLQWLVFDYHTVISIDIDGNDYWILDKLIPYATPSIICAEFNPAFTDSRTIKYNPNHEWDGTDYYGFSFEAGKKLSEKHGYEIIFNVANMNLIMVRKDLIGDLYVPPVSYEQLKFFKESNRTDWEWI